MIMDQAIRFHFDHKIHRFIINHFAWECKMSHGHVYFFTGTIYHFTIRGVIWCTIPCEEKKMFQAPIFGILLNI